MIQTQQQLKINQQGNYNISNNNIGTIQQHINILNKIPTTTTTTKSSMDTRILLMLLALVCYIEAGPDEDKLITEIFDTRQYNSMSRPVKTENETLKVVFEVLLQQIIDVDEKNEMLYTNLWLNFDWQDWNLKWDPTHYGNVSDIRLPSKSVWTPDVLLYNSVDENIDSKLWTNVIVESDGSCNWVPLGLYKSSCSINITWFPFDEQYCHMKFGSWTYDSSKLNLTTEGENPMIDLSTYQTSGEWKLIAAPASRNIKVYDCCPGTEYLDITYTLHIRRRTLYYGFNLILPCSLISTLTLVTFVLPPDAGEKIGLGVTILLSLSVFQMIVADMTPPTSMAVPLIGIYFGCVMVMSTLSIVMTVVVLYLHHSTPDMCKMPNWVRTVICEWLAWLLRMSRPGKQLSLKGLLRKASVRQLEGKMPPSLSLLANVEDIDNTIQFSKHYIKVNKMDQDDPTGIALIRNEILAILNEVRFITRKIKEDSKSAEETNEWKFAAMVLDRLCFWVFTAYLTLSTLGIFLSAPNFIDTSIELPES